MKLRDAYLHGIQVASAPVIGDDDDGSGDAAQAPAPAPVPSDMAAEAAMATAVQSADAMAMVNAAIQQAQAFDQQQAAMADQAAADAQAADDQDFYDAGYGSSDSGGGVDWGAPYGSDSGGGGSSDDGSIPPPPATDPNALPPPVAPATTPPAPATTTVAAPATTAPAAAVATTPPPVAATAAALSAPISLPIASPFTQVLSPAASPFTQVLPAGLGPGAGASHFTQLLPPAAATAAFGPGAAARMSTAAAAPPPPPPPPPPPVSHYTAPMQTRTMYNRPLRLRGDGTDSDADLTDLADLAVAEAEETDRPSALVPFTEEGEALAPPQLPAQTALNSELPGVSSEAWTKFARAMRTAQRGAVSASNGIGGWELKPRRLADLGLMKNTSCVRSATGRMVWVGEFVSPLTLKDFLANTKLQYQAFSASMRKYLAGLRNGSIAKPDGGTPAGITLSGVLAILHRCGPNGLKSWNTKQFPDTAALYESANGIF